MRPLDSARARFLVRHALPKWIETARRMGCADVADVLATQRERLLAGEVEASEVFEDVRRAQAALLQDALYTGDDDDR